MYCKECGKQIDDDSKFCRYCGTKLTYFNTNEQKTDKSKDHSVIKSRTTRNDYKNSSITIVGIIAVIIFGILNFYTINNFEAIDNSDSDLSGWWFLSFILKIIFTGWIIQVAKKLNRNEVLWGILGFLFTGIIMIIIGLMPELPYKIPDDSFIKANYYLIQGNYPKAISYYKNCILEGNNVKNKFLFYNLACAYASNNNTKEALDSLIKALDLGHIKISNIKKDPHLNALKNEPLFQQILEKQK